MDRAPTRCIGGHRVESLEGILFFSLSLFRDRTIITSVSRGQEVNTGT